MNLTPEDAERLASIKRRISTIRAALEDPSLITEITIDGVSEKVNRSELRAELRELEAEERILSGTSAKLYGIRLE